MQAIPLQAVPNQALNVVLGGQLVTIVLAERAGNVYCDLYVGSVAVITGVVCRNVNRIVRDLYLGFSGDLVFVDTQGSDDPQYQGLGARWVLVYLTAVEAQDA